MRLESLAKYDKQTASLILATAAMRNYATSVEGGYIAEADAVIEEIAGKLKLDRDDAKFVNELDDNLTKLIRDQIMGDVSIEEVETRMGFEGRLPLSAYDIVFDADVLKIFGENRRFVEAVVRNPDDVQHEGMKNSDGMVYSGASIFLKRVDQKNKIGFWLLVHAVRMGKVFYVHGIHRLFDDIFDMSDVRSPLDMLKMYVDTYGMLFDVGNFVHRQRFLERVYTPVDYVPNYSNVHVHLEGNERYRPIFTGSDLPMANRALGISIVIERVILIGYVVNLSRYSRDKLARV